MTKYYSLCHSWPKNKQFSEKKMTRWFHPLMSDDLGGHQLSDNKLLVKRYYIPTSLINICNKVVI